MDTLRSILIITTVAKFPGLIYAKPQCTTYGEKDVVCTAGSGDYTLKRGLVSDNDKTTGVTLKGCRISEINYESFKNLPILKYIDLSENKIQQLKLGVLDETRQVTYLNLSYNFLTDFPLGLFDQKPNLDVLDLRGNRIKLLEVGTFDALHFLKHLDLSSNALAGNNINPALFDKCRLIRFMDFSRNDMSGAPDNLLYAFRELDFLNLDRCFLSEVPQFALKANLKTMKHLMLSTNQIRKLDSPGTFANIDGLEILNLAGNIIEHVNESTFWPLKKLKVIVLRNNRLKNIPDTVFQNLPKLGNIDLSHNIIEYVPVNAFRGTALRNLNLSDNRFTYLENNFCLELRNSGARLNKFFFNENPWQCACLNDILKEVKKYGVEYNSAKYNGEEPVCVTTKEFNCKRQQSSNEVYIELFDDISFRNKSSK